jgi:hypothetical protein
MQSSYGSLQKNLPIISDTILSLNLRYQTSLTAINIWDAFGFPTGAMAPSGQGPRHCRRLHDRIQTDHTRQNSSG